MPRRPGHPVRGTLDINAWRAALRTWLDLLFGEEGASHWAVTVSERTPEQYKSSKRRDDVRFTRTGSDGSEVAARTFDAVLAVARAQGRSGAFIVAAAAQVSGERRPREPREPRGKRGASAETSSSSSDDAEAPAPAALHRSALAAPLRATRCATAALAAPAAAGSPLERGEAALSGPICVDVALPDGRTVALRLERLDCVHHVWRALRRCGVAREGHVLVALLRRQSGDDASGSEAPRTRFNCCDGQPLDELLEPDERGRPLPGAAVTLRLLAAGD